MHNHERALARLVADRHDVLHDDASRRRAHRQAATLAAMARARAPARVPWHWRYRYRQ